MATPRSEMPLTSFDPRYRTILERGCREEFIIPCRTKAEAHRLQALLCTFRARLKRYHAADPMQWEPLYGTIVSKTPDGLSVRLRPRSAELSEILDQLELPLTPTPEVLPLVPDVPTSLPDDPLAKYLKD